MLVRVYLFVLSFLTIGRAANLAARGDLDRAWTYVNKRRFSILNQYPLTILSIEYSLMRMYLEMKKGLKIQHTNIFYRITFSDTNRDEKRFLMSYAIAALWMSRGRNEGCLLRIWQALVYDPGLVRSDFRDRFTMKTRAPDAPAGDAIATSAH